MCEIYAVLYVSGESPDQNIFAVISLRYWFTESLDIANCYMNK